MTYLDYELLVERGLLYVVREALKQVAKDGLKGAHHFYITLKTDFPGVVLPPYLAEEYPEEMTIVLQYQFWELKVTESYFSVVLSFNDQDENIKIPFNSILNFSDPSVNFSLEFTPRVECKKKEAVQDSSTDKNTDVSAESKVISLDRFRKKRD